MQQEQGHEAAPQASVPTAFTVVRRPTDPEGVWLHNDKPVWVVHYPATEVRGEHWQGYRSVEHIPAGRKPWAVNNKRIGGERGFASLEAALAAAEAA